MLQGEIEGHAFSVPADTVRQRLASFLRQGLNVIEEALNKAAVRQPGTIVAKFVVVSVCCLPAVSWTT